MLPGAESYWLVRFLFQRALAIIYLSAFLVGREPSVRLAHGNQRAATRL